MRLIETGNGFNFLDPNKYSFIVFEPKSAVGFLILSSFRFIDLCFLLYKCKTIIVK